MRRDHDGHGPGSSAALVPVDRGGGAATGVVRVSLFGPLVVATDAGTLDARSFSGVKPKQLLEVLLCERGHRVSKSRLAETLWGDALPQDHVATLETYVCVLRRTLDPRAGAHRSVVVTETAGYRIGPAGLEVDLDVFDRLRREAVDLSPAAALARLHAALALVRGQVLEDEPYAPWAQLLRDTYRDRAVQTLVDAGRLSLLSGDAPAARDLAQRAVELNPLAEPAYQVLMTAAYALRRQDEALAAFDRCRRLLGEELGADPMAETVALHLAILRHEEVPELVAGAGAGAGAETGAHRAPVVLTVPHQRSVSPRPAPSAPPEEPTLLGRERELSALQGAVMRAQTGRFTVALVTGGRGMGKTTVVEQLLRGCAWPVAAVRCSDVEATLPYLALSLALRTLSPGEGEHGLPTLDGLQGGAAHLDELTRMRVMEAFAGRVSGRPPSVLWLDDAQWADRETVATVGYLQRRCADTPLLVVLSCDPSRATLEAVRDLRPHVRVDLGPLSRSCVDALGHEDLFSTTAGHPLFVDGWLRARRHQLPQQFSPEVRERALMACWEAGPQGFRLLSAAAALDRPTFGVSLLAVLLDVDVPALLDELDHLVDLGLLTWSGQEVAFVAPALRSVLAAALSPARRSFVQERAQFLDDVLCAPTSRRP